MSIFQSLRWRIQMWHGLLLLAVVVGFCTLTYALQSANAFGRADDDLKMRLGVLTNLLGRSGPKAPGEPPSGPPRFDSPEMRQFFPSGMENPFYYVIWSRSGPLLEASAGAPPDLPRPDALGADSPKMRQRDGFREVYLFTPPGECLLVGRSPDPIKREMRDFAWRLLGVGGGVLGLGLAGGWWFSTRALRLVGGIRLAATQVAKGDLASRIPIDEPSSELGRLSAALNETFSKLESAFAQQTRFTADAAHELRTPVAVILAQAQLALGRARSPAEYRETIETTQRAAQRMHGLIESLLDLARLDAREKLSARRPCDLAAIAFEQLEHIRPLALERGIVLRGDLAPAACEADPEQVAQIFANLLGNAVKFSPAGSEVLLATGRENGEAVASVSDRGPGIAAEHLPHLFERFYRVDASRNRATGGAGLGLSICQRIADAHGGTLTVESELAKGSRFTLRIPVEWSSERC